MQATNVWAQGFQPQLVKLDSKKPKCNPGNKPCGGACIPNEKDCLTGKLENSLKAGVAGVALLGTAGIVGLTSKSGTFQKKAALAAGALGVGLLAGGVQGVRSVRQTYRNQARELEARIREREGERATLSQQFKAKEQSAQEAVAIMLKQASQQYEDLTNKKVQERLARSEILQDKETTEALLTYTLAKYEMINGCLRKNYSERCNKKQVAKYVDGIDRALALLPKNTQQDEHWRGAIFPADSPFAQSLDKLKVGTVLRDPAYSSYSAKESVAKVFSGKELVDSPNDVLVRFRTRSPKLTDVTKYSVFGDTEAERILPRGTKQRITSIDISREDGHRLFTISLEDA
jgi:outer membrane lipoprotein SlyB